MVDRKLADRPADITLAKPERLAHGYRDYQRYRLTLRGADGEPIEQVRDVLQAGKVVAVLPVDPARDKVVLIRQFRLPAQLANGCGDMIEIVAGRVEPGESLTEAARRECTEEIGVAPARLVELFSYLTTPGIADEEVTIFLARIDAGQTLSHVVNDVEGERIETVRVDIDEAIAALKQNSMRNGLLLLALQWLAINRGQLSELLR